MKEASRRNYCQVARIQSLEDLSKFTVDQLGGLAANITTPEAHSRVKNLLVAESRKLLPHFATSLASGLGVPNVSLADFENLERREMARKLADCEKILNTTVKNDKNHGLKALKDVKSWLFIGEKKQISLNEQLWKEPLGLMIYLWNIGNNSTYRYDLEFDCTGNMSYSEEGGCSVLKIDISEIKTSGHGQGYARNQLLFRIDALRPVVEAYFAPSIQNHTGRILVATPVPKRDRLEKTSTSGNFTTSILCRESIISTKQYMEPTLRRWMPSPVKYNRRFQPTLSQKGPHRPVPVPTQSKRPASAESGQMTQQVHE